MVFGCVGTIRLLAGYYLIVLTSYEVVDEIQGFRVYRASGFDIVRCFAPEIYGSLSPRQKRDEGRYLQLLRASLQRGSRLLYFSLGYDLTLNCQRQHLFSRSSASLPKFIARDKLLGSKLNLRAMHSKEVAISYRSQMAVPGAGDYPRTCWRTADKVFAGIGIQVKLSLQQLLRREAYGHDVQSMILPLVCGSFESLQESIMNITVKVSLISRTSIGRVGIRNHCRGVDAEGEAANFIETEQVLEVPGREALYSFVIVRGSVPVKWSQPLVDLAWNQQVLLHEPCDIAPVRRHFSRLLSRYGIVTVVDLLGTIGDEGRLKTCFKKALASLPLPQSHEKLLRYFQYDAHTESRRGCPASLKGLQIWSKLEICHQGYFAVTLDEGTESVVTRMQDGVFRVNCKDCLDRTNIFQCRLAQLALQEQLCAVLPQYGDSMIRRFSRLHRRLWANHGDRISLQYSGTGALKRDAVRVGGKLF